jgi:miniconductance mechanosensitive channel
MNFKLWSQQLEHWLRGYNFEGDKLNFTHLAVSLGFLILLSCGVWLLTRMVISLGMRASMSKRRTEWHNRFSQFKVFRAWSFVIIAYVFRAAFPFMFIGLPMWGAIAKTVIDVAIIITFLQALNATMNAIVAQLESTEEYSDKPIRSYKQVATIVFTIVAFILILAILMGESPLYILGGFGAITAVVLLIFKDALLGFVASVQMSAIDLVRIGDWIAMDKYGADGRVTEINLTTVKVQNWDMTMTLIPSYALVSESFKNWRGMFESDGRRIKRHISVNIASVKFIDDRLHEKLLKLDLIRDELVRRQNEINEHNTNKNPNRDVLLNGRHMTNIGVFRLYAQAYLTHNPNINTEMTYLVRQLQPTETGIPIEIYVFTLDKTFINYEAIAADIFDHLLAAIPYFELEVFQDPAGSDMRTFTRPLPHHS